MKLQNLHEASMRAVELAAQVWCMPKTENKVMDPELAVAFADVLDRVWAGEDIPPLTEDQYKMPSSAHRLRQAPFRSSFGRARSFGGVANGTGGQKE